MDASIIVCIYNRAESLRDTLSALRALKAPAGRQWEVIVVDNNSQDHTRAVVEEAQHGWPSLRYEFEGKQGLSHARNHGIACARGDLLLFTDDDVLPESDWLEKVLDGLIKHGAAACGGFIAPIWESPPPNWLTERFHGFVAVRTDRSDDYQITTNSQAPYGANMAIQRSVIDRVGGFDTNRGRKGKVLASGEDGEMFERILAAGYKVAFLGDAIVHHKVEAFRLRKQYIRRWRYQTSKNIAIARGMTGNRRVFNIPLFLFPQFGRALLRAAVGRFTEPSDEAFSREVIVFHFLGTFRGLIATRKSHNE